MMTRREWMGGTVGAALTTLLTGGSATVLNTETLHAQNLRRHRLDVPGLDAPRIQSLMREPLAPISNPIVDVITLELAPGSVSKPHEHTGPVFAYILEGEIENQVEPNPPKRYGPGDYFYEPPMHEHKMLTNLSATKPAKLLIFQVEQKGKPFTIMMKNKASSKA